MAIANPVKFIQEVRSEVAKVVWPTRRETLMTTVMVFIMAAITAMFSTTVPSATRSWLIPGSPAALTMAVTAMLAICASMTFQNRGHSTTPASASPRRARILTAMAMSI